MSVEAEQERWRRVGALFERAVILPRDQREAWILSACGGDERLESELRSLLAAEAAALDGEALRPPTDTDLVRWLDAPVSDDLIHKRLGDTTLTRRIAAGGMGVVYEGLQEPPGRKVAVKLLRSALAGEAGLQRFQQEARLLGNLRHPGIAQVYEAGTHVEPGGERLPYFVMEYVPEARTLVDYAQAKRMPLRERLALFVRVCEAVQFGHAKGVIHRDLKPGNLLVDADGNPKVIDFGIARTTNDDLGSPQPRTKTGQLVGTLPYMSPEQLVGRGEDLDTRSDVYALGVILYELLAGKLPYDLEGLGIVEAAGRIARQPPQPPAQLNPALAGDLSVILNKALAKDPGQRYESAAALGQDLQRFLHYSPITARPPSLIYQFRLFTRRHRALVASAVLALATLVVATIVSLQAAREERLAREGAEVQRHRAEYLVAQSRELVPWLLKEFSRDLAKQPGTLPARARLAERVRAHVDALAVTEQDDPEVLRSAAVTRWALGDVLGSGGGANLGRRAEAEQQYADAIRLFDQALARAPDDRDARLYRAQVRLAQSGLLRAQGDIAGARAAVEEVAALSERWLAEDAEDERGWRLRMGSWATRADLLWSEGPREAALADYRRMFEVRESGRRFANESDLDLRRYRVETRLNYGAALIEMNRAAEAEPLVRGLSQEAESLVGPEPDVEELRFLRFVHNTLGLAWFSIHRLEEAQEALDKALHYAQRWTAVDRDNAMAALMLLGAHHHLGLIAARRKDWPRAADHLRTAIAQGAARAAREPASSDVVWDHRVERTLLGEALREMGRHAEAAAELREALRMAQARVQALPREHWAAIGVRDVWVALAELESARGNHPGLSEEALARWVPLLEALGGPGGEAGAQWLWRTVARSNLEASLRCLEGAAEALRDLKRRGGWVEDLSSSLTSLEGRVKAFREQIDRLKR